MKNRLFCLLLFPFTACVLNDNQPHNAETLTAQTPTPTQRNPLSQLQRSTAANLASNRVFAQSIAQYPAQNSSYTPLADAAHQIHSLTNQFCKDANPKRNPSEAYDELAANIEKQFKTLCSETKLTQPRIDTKAAEELLKMSSLSGQRPELLYDEDFQKLSDTERHIYIAQLRADAAAGANEMLIFIAQIVGTPDIKIDKLMLLSTPKKGTILLGETFETDIALGLYSSQIKYTLSVNGVGLPVEDGAGHYISKSTQLGTQHFMATAAITNPMTGEVTKCTQEFYYEVVMPAAIVAAEGANILYLNQDNKVTIAVAGVSAGDLSIKTTAAEIISKSGTTYIVRPSKLGTATISITDRATNKLIGNFIFEVKNKTTNN